MFLDLHYCKEARDFRSGSSLLRGVGHFLREYLTIDGNYERLTRTGDGEAQHGPKHGLIQQILASFPSPQYEKEQASRPQ